LRVLCSLKRLADFLFIKSIGETHKNEHFSIQKNDEIFHIFDKIKVSRIFPSLYGGSIENTLTASLRKQKIKYLPTKTI